MAMPTSARATDLKWAAAGSSGNWDLATTNWINGAISTNWVQGDGAIFNGAVAPSVVVNASIQATQLNFQTAGFTIQPGSGTLTLGTKTGAGIILDGATIGLPIRGIAGLDVSLNTRDLTLAAQSIYTGPTTFEGTRSIHLATANALPAASDISWSTAATTKLDLATFDQSFHSLTISANGSLLSTGGNVTVAGSIVNNGSINMAGRYSNGDPVFGTGILRTPSLTGSGDLNLSKGATLSVGADNLLETYSGDINPGFGATDGGIQKVGSGEWIMQGTTRLTGPSGGPSFVVQEGTLAGNTNNLVGRIHVDAGGLVLFAMPANGSFAGYLDGTGDMRVNGVSLGTASTLTLSLPSYNTGKVTVGGGGVLSVSSDSQLGTLSITGTTPSTTYATLVFDGGTLRTTSAVSSSRAIIVTAQGGTLDTNSQAWTYSGSLTSSLDGGGTLRVIGAGVADLHGANIKPRALALDGGNVHFSSNAAASIADSVSVRNASLTIDSGSQVGVGGAVQITAAGSPANVNLNGGRLAVGGDLTLGVSGGAATGSLTCASTAQLTVAGATTLFGSSSLTIQGGTIALGNLQSDAAATLTISPSSKLTPVGVTVGGNGLNGYFPGQISGGGGLTKIGTNIAVFAGTNTYTGPTVISGGELLIIGSSTSSNTLVNDGAALAVSGSLTGTVSVSQGGMVTGTGSVGSMVVGDGGMLKLGDASLSQFTVNGALTLNPGSTTTVDVNANGSDRIVVTGGDVSLDGTLAFHLLSPNTVPAVGSRYTVVSLARGLSTVGTFATVTGFDVGGGLRLAPISSNKVNFVVTYAGDADENGAVNFSDLLALARHYGQSARSTWFDGDFNYNGTVDFTDLLALAREYAQSSPLAGQAAQLVAAGGTGFAGDWALAQALAPEPAALAACVGLASVVFGRRRTR